MFREARRVALIEKMVDIGMTYGVHGYSKKNDGYPYGDGKMGVWCMTLDDEENDTRTRTKWAQKTIDSFYAKVLHIEEHAHKGTWVYAPGMVTVLNETMSLSLDIAAKLGAHHGICMICGAELTDPASVKRGIGPVCAAKL